MIFTIMCLLLALGASGACAEGSTKYAYDNSVGFLDLKQTAGGYTARQWFKDPYTVYAAPDGEIKGEIVLLCKTKTADDYVCEETAPYYFSGSNGKKSKIKPALVSLECYTEQVLVFEVKDDWYKTSFGWVKLPETIKYVPWRDYLLNAEINRGGYPYQTLSEQYLLREEGASADKLTEYGNESQNISTKKKYVHILATKGDYALVAVTKLDGFYCSTAAVRGDIGWIRIVDEKGHPLIKAVYGCC